MSDSIVDSDTMESSSSVGMPPNKGGAHEKTQRPNSLHSQSKGFVGTAIVCLSAIGVVFGDIGTSPLYVYKSIFKHVDVTKESNVLGITSLIFWSVTLVVCIKYLIFIMRADHQREGGVFALLSLILFGAEGGKHNIITDAVPLKRVDSSGKSPSSSMVEFNHIDIDEVQVKKFPHPWIVKRNLRRFYIILSMLGSGLLLGDGVITPAISVLSAVEGLKTVSSSLDDAILPITLVILICMFFAQQLGTGKVGIFFGPIMILWFITLAGLGIYHISLHPAIFKVLSPTYAVAFFKENGVRGWEALGAVVLCITGCEAMYADMGHFGKNAVRFSWLIIVYPALILNYLGQGAMLIEHPAKIDDPFFESVPHRLFWPIFILSIMSTIIASQALISGAFSLTQQAVSLASFPRLKIIHTSSTVEGQIYIPFINVLLMICCILLVVGFRTSDNLASAYGVAVCGDMLLTTIFFISLAFLRWRWHPAICIWLAIQFGVIDLAFLTSNLRKVPSGGWFPLMFASILVILMYVWRAGQLRLKSKIYDEQVPVDSLIAQMRDHTIAQCSGIGVFMTAVSEGIPHVCTQFLKHVPVMHKTAVFVTIHYRHEPFVPRSESKLIQVGSGIYRMVIENGYMETSLNAEHMREVAQLHNTDIDFPNATYYFGNELVGPRPGTWTGHKLFVELFNLLLQFSHKSTASAFHIPDRNLIYVGSNYLL